MFSTFIVPYINLNFNNNRKWVITFWSLVENHIDILFKSHLETHKKFIASKKFDAAANVLLHHTER